MTLQVPETRNRAFAIQVETLARAEALSRYDALSFPRLTHTLRADATTETLHVVSARRRHAPGAPPIAAAILTASPGRVAELVSLFVAPLYRCYGLSHVLLQGVERVAQAVGSPVVQARYRHDYEFVLRFESALTRARWGAPKTRAWVLRADARRLPAGSWIERATPPEGMEIFPWVELRDDERAMLEARAAAGGFVAGTSPLQLPQLVDPRISVGLRRDGVLVGWNVAHGMGGDAVQYSGMYIEPEARSLRATLALLGASFRRQLDAGYRWGTTTIEVGNQAPQRLIARFLRPVLVSCTDVRVSGKRLRMVRTGAPTA